MDYQKDYKVRLSQEEIKAIVNSVKAYDLDAEIFIFGSRVDLTKKGGDIDILVLSDKIGWKERRKIRVNLLKELGDRKIDLIVSRKDKIDEPIVKLALSSGVRIDV
jgi:predicted nucleotidyltransferase